MRVTKAIREYVEEEISKKYDAVINNVGKDYYAERDNITDHVKEIMQEASNKAVAYLESVGYSHSRCDKGCIFDMYGWIQHKEKEEETSNIKAELTAKKHAKIKQVLFDLEMGDTQKKQLREVLDSIIVEGV